MTNTISFMSANYVARQLGYTMTGGWGQGDSATNDYFRPVKTFPERFEEMLRDIGAMGFKALDLWTAHLNPAWASEEHIALARDLLDRHGLKVVSLAGGFGSSREGFRASCKLAVALGAPVLGGGTQMLEEDRGFVVETLKGYGVRLGIENHPEKTPEEMLSKIGDGGGGIIGTALDTGWYGTQGYDAAKAVRELKDQLVHVHLKDVLRAGNHDTCRYGEGVVPVRACVRALHDIGYEGAISVEHEPEHFDPTEDCKANLRMLRDWLGQDA